MSAEQYAVGRNGRTDSPSIEQPSLREWRAYQGEPRPNRSEDELRGCTCSRCNPLSSPEIDRGDGAGSTNANDDYNDARSYDHDLPSSSATQIPYWNIEDKVLDDPRFHSRRSKYERLHSINKGSLDSDLSVKQRISDKKRAVHTIANQLGIEGPFVEEATELVLQVDLRSVGTEEPLIKYTLAALSLTHERYFRNLFDEKCLTTKHKNLGGEDGGESVEWVQVKAPFGGKDTGPAHQIEKFESFMNDIDMDFNELRRLQKRL